MIPSKDVRRFWHTGFIDGGFVIPKPAGTAVPKMGSWAIVLDTADGEELMQNQRGLVYTFGTIDAAAKFLVDNCDQAEVLVDLEYDGCWFE